MTPSTINWNKINPFLPSEQVKEILKRKGLSKIFNYTDYNHFKKQVQESFNVIEAIAEMFIQENTNQSDFNDYIF